MGNCRPIHKQMLPKPRMWALQEGPHQLCCCWTRSHLLRHLMAEKKRKKARGGCGNRVVEVVVEGNKKPVLHLHFDCEWLGLRREQFLSIMDKRGMEIHLCSSGWCCCKKSANAKFKTYLLTVGVCMFESFHITSFSPKFDLTKYKNSIVLILEIRSMWPCGGRTLLFQSWCLSRLSISVRLSAYSKGNCCAVIPLWD